MLFLIAWRNLKRNRRRSAVVLASIVVGVVSLMLYDGLSYGMMVEMLDNAIGNSIGHIQIHGKGFHDNRVIQLHIPDRAEAERALEGVEGISGWSSRVVSFGLLSSALGSSGGIMLGVDSAREQGVSYVGAKVVEGRYVAAGGREILVGRKMAEKLHVGIGDKVVGMASALDGEVGSELFRVVGIFETVSSDFDKTHVFIPLGTVQGMLSMEQRIVEIAITVQDVERVDEVASEIRSRLGEGYEVLTYKEQLPILVATLEMYDQMLFIIYLIIGLAMIFGIVNTMLMSVFERIQEFGVLMAIGMRNRLVFNMVMAEALCLAAVGTLAGLILGTASTLLLGHVGINLRMFAEGFASFGVGTTIYPVLRLNGFLGILVTIPVTTMLGAVYPAWRATRLQPVSAIRYV
ncbi:MAG: FtsX-like permease family protein [Bacteroidia bacterium]|nr:FtsX-like permease family protein [Bacteroidia bacterium]